MTLRHQEKPIAEACKQSQTVGTNTEGVGGFNRQTNLLEEICRCICEAESTDKLSAEDNAGDLSSTTLEALKAVPVARSDGELFFEIVGVDDCREGVFWINMARLALQTAEGLLSFVEPVVSNKMVW